jgi:polysaccharide export outer membrane protein
VLIGVILCGVVSCAAKGYTKARSETIAEARDRGEPILSIEEERERFFAEEREQNKRLLEVLEKRSRGTSHDAHYRIGAQDEIEINVFDVPELNLEAKVGQSGLLSLPLIGGVQAGGLTESELQEELTKKISAYVRRPQVTVTVSNFGSQKVAVMGAVDKPGTYPLKKGLNSVLELVSEAGGVSGRAGNYLNFVPVEISGLSAANDVEARARLALEAQAGLREHTRPIEVALDAIMGTSGGIPIEIPVRGGDMVIIPEGGKVMVEGEVEKTGAYELGQRMTLLGALAASGGITYGAKIDEIEVVREVGLAEKRHLVVSIEDLATGKFPDVKLRNGDIVRVPSANGRRLSQDIFDGVTRVINFGIGGNVALAS